MFRLSQYMREIVQPTPLTAPRKPPGPVVIWNLIRRCNLTCKHCYTTSADINFPGELSTAEIHAVMDDLKAFKVPVLILSGGEPLLHPDIFAISQRARDLGFYVALSSNGTLITERNIEQIAAIGYQYIGVSLDGMADAHDKFRQKQGSFDAALAGIRLCRNHDIKAGVRFTLTQDNAHDFNALLQLMDDEDIDKFYLSHLNYGGRGNRNRKDDATFQLTRSLMDSLFERCLDWERQGLHREVVTGNNDADAVYFLHWVKRHFPERADHIQAKLQQWGGNASGVNVANIDNLGNVHPDTFWWHYGLGNVRHRAFSQIWQDVSDPLMAGLKATPRPLQGRCGTCHYQAICNGNTRVRAQQVSGNVWAEDPGCYLHDMEVAA
ncbi:MAG: heme d1 biosynthesis radical SAM protein NirJ [Methylomonas sp.]|nr:heme d1 biosynthesis radical SAM protein NirJ [Methylomonas sp.]PPD21677.1 MAG: heme d1 biosynthesis radical SAM protein NirJ [Methylomonas sp.]PPD25944.1 MAG: heme d1 biosynthesis radical SAM protein NirJ [Methylomonas sp.]PPD37680.1 MAG: heme d1 biosynthesis radical SAM protein NirJ [Methylomonas sp.]PPD40692.1 MAG: heme d1 biosynthesis radical SAM protein NirJ [Methylomonas sp.]